MTHFQDSRDSILQALESGAPLPHVPLPAAAPPLPAASGALGSAALVQQFTAAAQENMADAAHIGDLSQLPAAAAAWLQQKSQPLVALCEEQYLSLDWAGAGMLAECRAPQTADACGLTGVIAAAASNGALLLADDTPHRLTLSLTPPYHIAVLHAADIARDLTAVWARLPQPLPRSCVLVCGPSRTADIEQTLTLGAHGPVGMLIVVVGESTD